MNYFSVSLINKANSLNISSELLQKILETNLVPIEYRRDGIYTTDFGNRRFESIVEQLDCGVSLFDIVRNDKKHLASV